MKTLATLWLSMLLGFLRPAVEEPPVEDPPADDAPPDDAPGDDLPPDDEPPSDPPRRTAAQDLEDERRGRREEKERFERELAEARRSNQPAPQNDEQRQRADEDRILADPATPADEKWRINANREIRSTRNIAAQTMLSAQDVADQTNFNLACSQNPRLAAVKDEVERELATMRGKGQNANRRELARYLLGKKLEEAPAAKKKTAADASNVNRGRPAGSGSDVPRKGGSRTEHQKRAERLANVNI